MGMTDAQRSAVIHTGSHCKVTSTAGSGKTTVLTARAMHRYAQGSRMILGLTFTKAAAANMAARTSIPPGRAMFRTFHSLSYQLVQDYTSLLSSHKIMGGRSSWMVDRWADAASKKWGVDPQLSRQVFDLLQGTGDPADTWVARGPRSLRSCVGASLEELPKAAVLNAAADIHVEHRDNGFITFGDLGIEAVRLLGNDASLREYLQDTIEDVMVDEFQDTDPAQARLLQLLVRRDNLFVVGDLDQLIHQWRGCSPEYMLDFGDHFGKHRVINLGMNFRCLPAIVSAADKLIQHNTARDQKVVEAHRDGDAAVTCEGHDTATQEAAHVVADMMDRHTAGTPYRSMAALYRTNAYAGPLEVECMSRGVPVHSSGGGFFELTEVRTLLEWLRAAAYHDGVSSLDYIWNRPNRYASRATLKHGLDKAPTRVSDVFDRIRSGPFRSKDKDASDRMWRMLSRVRDESAASPKGGLLEVIRQTNYDKYVRALAAKPNKDLASAVDAVERLCTSVADRYETVDAMFSSLDLVASRKTDRQPEEDALNLSTIHAAKGLEWPAVYVVGCSSGHLPHKKSVCMEEERRLMFVAATRARDTLSLSYVEEPSPFLRELGLKLEEPDGHTQGDGAPDAPRATAPVL